MTTTSATGASTTGLGTTANTTSQLSQSMNADTFLKMFTAELTNQDPTKPMETADFLNQFSQITQVQSATQLASSMANFQTVMSNVLNSSNASQGVGLLGKNVQYTDANGAAQSGQVSAMAIQPDGSVKLDVNGVAVDLSSVTQVQ